MHSPITCRLFLFARIVALIVALALIPSFVSSAQNQSAFTAEDVLDVTNVSVADISDDGRWIAAIAASLRDRIGIDNSRFGDPTYASRTKWERGLAKYNRASKQMTDLVKDARIYSNLGMAWKLTCQFQ